MDGVVVLLITCLLSTGVYATNMTNNTVVDDEASGNGTDTTDDDSSMIGSSSESRVDLASTAITTVTPTFIFMMSLTSDLMSLTTTATFPDISAVTSTDTDILSVTINTTDFMSLTTLPTNTSAVSVFPTSAVITTSTDTPSVATTASIITTTAIPVATTSVATTTTSTAPFTSTSVAATTTTAPVTTASVTPTSTGSASSVLTTSTSSALTTSTSSSSGAMTTASSDPMPVASGTELPIILGITLPIVLALALVIVILTVYLRYSRRKRSYSIFDHGENGATIKMVELSHTRDVADLDALFAHLPHIPSIQLSHLEAHVKELDQQPDKLEDEFQMVREYDHDFPHAAALATANGNKNRYANILPFDETRVVLSRASKKHTDYINASYICGNSLKREYIATQGPLPNTVDDFWRMVWETNCNLIVMVTNPIEGDIVKCETYWPSPGTRGKYGHISVTCDEETVKPSVTMRQFQLSLSQKTEVTIRNCMQLHYTAWPDMGVPNEVASMLRFANLVRDIMSNTNGPIVVHCSAGVGRTGTFIAIDIVLQQLKNRKTINIQQLVMQMRAQRPTMVQTQVQYMFIYNCILHRYLYGETEVTRDNLRTHFDHLLDAFEDTEEGRMDKEFEGAIATFMPDKTMLEAATDNSDKNRPGIGLPLDINRVCLNDPDDSGEDYINASFIACIGRRAEYILTQHPLKNTTEDFWRMILEKHISIIVLIGPVHDEVDMYWPTEGELNYDTLMVTLVDSDETEGIDVRSFEVYHSVSDVVQNVTMFHLLDWPTEEGDVPTSTENFLLFIKLIQKHANNMLAVVHTSASLPLDVSGVFCVVNSLSKQLQQNSKVDVMTIVKRTLQQRPKCITSKDQYQFIYECLVGSLDN